MANNDEWLRDFVAKRTLETWERFKRPYYISFIATDTAKAGMDYKTLITPLKLRQWAVTTEVPGIRVVEHPLHKAKVGFIPADQEYAFEDEAGPAPGSPRPPKSRPPSRRRLTLQFLETLAALPDDELDQIDIPIGTIVRLLRD